MSTETILITMTLSEFKNLINEAVNKAMEEQFSPLRKRFEERNISLKEAAKALGVSERTLYNLEEKGVLKMVRVGGRTFVKESSITQLING